METLLVTKAAHILLGLAMGLVVKVKPDERRKVPRRRSLARKRAEEKKNTVEKEIPKKEGLLKEVKEVKVKANENGRETAELKLSTNVLSNPMVITILQHNNKTGLSCLNTKDGILVLPEPELVMKVPDDTLVDKCHKKRSRPIRIVRPAPHALRMIEH